MSVAETVRHEPILPYAATTRAGSRGSCSRKPNLAGITYLETAFEFGKPRVKAFEETIRRSRKVLLIISPFFLADGTQEFVRILGISHGLQTSKLVGYSPCFSGRWAGLRSLRHSGYSAGWMPTSRKLFDASASLKLARDIPASPSNRKLAISPSPLAASAERTPVRCRGSLRRS